MGTTSNHYEEIAVWIEKVIKSCETLVQTKVAGKLLQNFENRLISEFPETYWPNHHYDVIRPLNLKLLNKKDEVLKKQLS
jgi:hypothetical protein